MTENKICTLEVIRDLTHQWKIEKEKVVFTNGCFDILHLGHVDYLEKAAHLGDKLVVGLNSDLSVRKLKGSSRPLNNEYARSRLIASLGFVSAVVIFNEETPLQVITTIYPDILVKGDDYQVKDIVGAEQVLSKGGRVETISFVDGYSTTSLINKILQNKD